MPKAIEYQRLVCESDPVAVAAELLGCRLPWSIAAANKIRE
jgi:hypothetical protein